MGFDVNLHAFMQSEISFLAHAQVAATIPNLTLGNQVMHQLLAERLTQGSGRESPAVGSAPATRPGTASSSTTTPSAARTSAGSATAPT